MKNHSVMKIEEYASFERCDSVKAIYLKSKRSILTFDYENFGIFSLDNKKWTKL